MMIPLKKIINMRIIYLNKCSIVILFSLVIFNFYVCAEQSRRWHQNDDDDKLYPATHSMRHHNSHHHSQHHQLRHHQSSAQRSQSTNLRMNHNSHPTNAPIKNHNMRNNHKMPQQHQHIEHNKDKKNLKKDIRIITTTIRPILEQQKPQLFKNKLKQPRNDLANISTILESRHFDRDGLYSVTKKATIAKPNPPKIRHPYDILNVPYKDRIQESQIHRNSINQHNNARDRIMYAMRPQEKSKFSFDNMDDDVEEDEEDDYNDEYLDDLNNNTNGDDKEQLQQDDGSLKHVRASSNYEEEEDTDDIFSKSYIPGTLTKHKLNTLGTHDAVKQSRQTYLTKQHKQALATAHASRIYTEASCRWPKPKILPVQNDPAKIYLPHCTILYRCGDDTGCCNTDARTCIARSSQTVDLYFYVSTLGSSMRTIEKQSFINHTECQCVDKLSPLANLPPEPMRRAAPEVCNCPKLFESVTEEGGTCRCDCASDNVGCDWKKKGKEHFSMEDRKCIIDERCKVPTCDFGQFNRRHGRCPRKEEKLAIGFSHMRN